MELEKNGFQAYFVGGCVRDSILKTNCHDVDIATNALPDEVMSVFSKYTVIPTGLKYGTVTVLDENIPYEITTYRTDGNYSDCRRPDFVCFTGCINDDLARRDFTVNAVAMDVRGNIIDPFGGCDDIRNGIIRCVGEPEKRFSEDALRIMRAIRFSSQLGFGIAPETAEAIHQMIPLLNGISPERIRVELDKLICGENCVDVLLNFSDVISGIIPEFSCCVGFDQHSDFHRYNVWEHIVRAMSFAPQDDVLVRRSLLFHDIGKPECAKFDEKGKGHFKGHAEVSADMSVKIMKRMRYDNKSVEETAEIIRFHSNKINGKIETKKFMSVLGERLFFKLVAMKKCDNSAKNDFVLKQNEPLDEAVEFAHEILKNGECFTIRQLDVNGNDLLALGINGTETGRTLNELLNLVIEEKLENNKESLLNFVERR